MTAVRLAGGPDYVRYVAPRREVWVTEPDEEQIEVFSLVSTAPPRLAPSARIRVRGGPESLVVDPARGRAYTHLWVGRTVAIDLARHAVADGWDNGCSGARGIALDARKGWLFAGCAEGKGVVMDLAHGGRILSTARAGEGVDIIAYNPALRHLYLPGADAGTLTVLSVGPEGRLTKAASLPIPRGAHCAASDPRGGVWICDPHGGRILRYPDGGAPAAR